MNVLAICSSLNNSYVALEYENKLYSEIIKSDENYHSLYIIPKIKEIIEKNSITLDKLDILTTNCGPGSFTGIRAALSIVKVMAEELNIDVVGLNSAEILLSAFDKDILLMDARRDMYFVGTKNNIELVYKNDIKEKIQNKSLLTDKRCFEIFKDSLCFEDVDIDLGKVMIELAKEKYQNSKDKTKFHYLNLQANYIQTPPVF